MRVLITNNSLVAHAGSELYVRDLAIELLRRGHQPIAYSTQLGGVAEELRAATIPVVDRLDLITETPDIIHGHHHYETLSALLRFPDTPAIYYCHGWLPWQEAALQHPSIVRYVAVDALCRERLIEGGVPPDQIELIFNFFDQRLFAPRPALPARPKRALVFNNEFTEQTGLPVLREVCRRCDIELDVIGRANRNPTADPGPLLAAYDIVFAKARAAIEALAVGTAVILCAPAKLGPMVTTANFEALRPWNFGVRTLTQPLDPDLVTAEVQRYNHEDAARVSQLTRAVCELQPAVDRIVDLYRRVLATPPPNRCSAGASAARYLEQWAPLYKVHFAIPEDRDRWIDRSNAAEQPLIQELDTYAARLGAEVLRSRELFQQAVNERDAEIVRLSRELTAIRNSVTWRWSQRVLHASGLHVLLTRVRRGPRARSGS